METYIALLLLVMPGYISRCIFRHLEDNLPENGRFTIIVQSLAYDIFILPLTYFLIHFVTPDIDQVQTFFMVPRYVGLYILAASFSSVLIAFVWRGLFPVYKWFINWFRNLIGMTEISIQRNVFDDMFGDGAMHWVEVYQNGKLISRGLLIDWWITNGELALDVDAECIEKLYTANKNLVYTRTYVNTAQNLVVKEIDPDA